MGTRDVVWFGICLLALGLFALFERHQGAVGCVAGDVAKAAPIQQAIAIKEGASAEKAKEEGNAYRENTGAPVTGAPLLELCPPAVPPAPHQVLPAPAARPGPLEAPEPRAADLRQPAAATWDSTPVVQVGRDGDAQINGLLDYIRDNCAGPK
jgi:hypothetical protein